MNTLDSGSRQVPEDDELDDILNGIVEGRDVPSTAKPQPATQSQFNNSNKAGDNLGLDEEIIVTKKRIPIPKLDEHRLLSDPGVRRLQRISKERLKLKGKGHEYGDIARMLNMYQLWLDDLYPRAKFADALTILEKLGHTKRMQLIRKDWINEGKPQRRREEDEAEGEETGPDVIFSERQSTPTNPTSRSAGLGTMTQSRDGVNQEDPDEDELDALLAESEQPSVLPVRSANREEDAFADEMEAMEGLEW